jgi:hypothetical protein
VFSHDNRIRRVKCDEKRPACRRCLDTGRKCDGYNSPFILCAKQPVVKARAGTVQTETIVPYIWHISPDVSPHAIALLGRCFSTKTLFDVKLGCDEEAKQVLQVGLVSPVIRHAVASLRALREDLDTHGDVFAPITPPTSRYAYGLQQYCKALSGLASHLSMPGPARLKSALLCCQLFFSIEQVQGHSAGMARHLIQGLRIMDQYGARPKLIAANILVPAFHEQLPLLDVFVIKLFAAPCKFADPPASAGPSGTVVAKCPLLLSEFAARSRSTRAIAPDRRAELTTIATHTLTFLGKVSHVRSAEEALLLLADKDNLLNMLDRWLVELEFDRLLLAPHGPEPFSITFARLFHQTLKTVLAGTLDPAKDLSTRMQSEYDRLLGIAVPLEQRIRKQRTMAAVDNALKGR